MPRTFPRRALGSDSFRAIAVLGKRLGRFEDDDGAIEQRHVVRAPGITMTSKKASLNGQPPADLSVFGRRAVITIRPTRSLAQHTGIDLVPLPDGRALIMFDHPQTTAELELLILDALNHAGLDAEDRRVFEGIGTILELGQQEFDRTIFLQRYPQGPSFVSILAERRTVLAWSHYARGSEPLAEEDRRVLSLGERGSRGGVADAEAAAGDACRRDGRIGSDPPPTSCVDCDCCGPPRL